MKNYKPKYSLMQTKTTKIQAIRINETDEVVRQDIDPVRYAELRKLAVKNLNKRNKDELMDSLGLKKVKGNLGGTYYE